MPFNESDLTTAVMFFSSNGEIVREMHFAEFEALLDAYVPAIDMANQSHRAVYIEVDLQLHVRKTVFFKISFTAKGEVDPGWQVPLELLSRNAAKGPDMGAGAVALACSSRCPIDHFRNFLWDPDMSAGKGEFQTIKKAVERNKLALRYEEPEEEEIDHESVPMLEPEMNRKMRDEYMLEFRRHMAQVIKEQRFRSNTILNEKNEAIEEVKREYNARLEDYRLQVEEQEKQLGEERALNQSLKDTVDGQAEKIAGLREYFEVKLEQAQGNETEVFSQLKENHEAEMSANIEAATKELKEMLQMREVELLYRNEQEVNLREEISRLRTEIQENTANSGDFLLEKMVDKGISFVTYQPGAGHITIPMTEIARFMENPAAYAADYCGVSEAQYRAWLHHYHTPVCQEKHEDGGYCGADVKRIESPADFHIGESDRCEKHKRVSRPNLKLA